MATASRNFKTVIIKEGEAGARACDAVHDDVEAEERQAQMLPQQLYCLVQHLPVQVPACTPSPPHPSSCASHLLISFLF